MRKVKTLYIGYNIEKKEVNIKIIRNQKVVTQNIKYFFLHQYIE